VYGLPRAHYDAAGLHGEYFSFFFELQDGREPIQAKREDAPTYTLYDALTSPRLVLEDEDNRHVKARRQQRRTKTSHLTEFQHQIPFSLKSLPH
jgi:hypothetical protein